MVIACLTLLRRKPGKCGENCEWSENSECGGFGDCSMMSTCPALMERKPPSLLVTQLMIEELDTVTLPTMRYGEHGTYGTCGKHGKRSFLGVFVYNEYVCQVPVW